VFAFLFFLYATDLFFFGAGLLYKKFIISLPIFIEYAPAKYPAGAVALGRRIPVPRSPAAGVQPPEKRLRLFACSRPVDPQGRVDDPSTAPFGSARRTGRKWFSLCALFLTACS